MTSSSFSAPLPTSVPPSDGAVPPATPGAPSAGTVADAAPGTRSGTPFKVLDRVPGGAAVGAGARRDVVVGVLAVQGDVREHIATIESLGGRAVAVRRPAELAAVDGLIIPGGESTTIDKLTRTFGLSGPLRELIAGGLPVYGSCAGMIMLSDVVADPSTDRSGAPQQTLGGLDMVVRRNAFGRQRESFETDLDFTGLATTGSVRGDDPVRAVFIRAPWVEKVGEGVEVLAEVPASETPQAGPQGGVGRRSGAVADPELEPVARIVAVRSGNLLATSFHPEVTGERRVHELFIRMIRGEA
ncbi:pyridoxal 5'-phosphate synthase glutaminase subunit PdxT [Arthrobacter agilis]|uniref:pyridoxal 5'-phosphate synthase glutaminase subunit PdxT n=1 Tax=Arthrobacter agilis TaxID=37921 RepID=UPI000B350C4B|nr:pyridoxal 5'-phosphate synthase glutaminase subunit PdxT [Arthrobacter agilis]OUM44596.1 pyridoxal 5'-phosphate synthase glutaminase subunit PdxT [Arthrobacter agilis]PPB47552.1 pyridoxal 5'-phosphate synthase glutaminase subunit PdxT [Arthrobacter agilis]TPV22710.1 pyridoxal 5'-phosphate synthase glutaminase subunit PdxT [Arthrobacter agilis]